MMEGVDMCDAFLVSYCSTRRRLKKYYQKHFHHLLDICSLNIYFLYNKNQKAIRIHASHYSSYNAATASTQNP
jgi:hypothetical protein